MKKRHGVRAAVREWNIPNVGMPGECHLLRELVSSNHASATKKSPFINFAIACGQRRPIRFHSRSRMPATVARPDIVRSRRFPYHQLLHGKDERPATLGYARGHKRETLTPTFGPCRHPLCKVWGDLAGEVEIFANMGAVYTHARIRRDTGTLSLRS